MFAGARPGHGHKYGHFYGMIGKTTILAVDGFFLFLKRNFSRLKKRAAPGSKAIYRI